MIVVKDASNDALSALDICRLNIFAARDLLLTQDPLDHITYVEACHIVAELHDCKFPKSLKVWTILVMFMGLVGW